MLLTDNTLDEDDASTTPRHRRQRSLYYQQSAAVADGDYRPSTVDLQRRLQPFQLTTPITPSHCYTAPYFYYLVVKLLSCSLLNDTNKKAPTECKPPPRVTVHADVGGFYIGIFHTSELLCIFAM